MAVFQAASDETESGGRFYLGGFVAPVLDWENCFAPAWEERVLNGDPPLPYFHMTDMRSREWRKKYGLTETESERRIDEAVRVIHSTGSLFLLTSQADGLHFRETFSGTNMVRRSKQPALDRFEPDHLCFLYFGFIALAYAHQQGAERVDFVVEKKQGVTRTLQAFYDGMPDQLREAGFPELAELIGDFLPGGKDRVPLQAADMACWYAQRKGSLSQTDQVRFRKIGSRFGYNHEITNEYMSEMFQRARQNQVPSPFKPKPGRRVG